MKEKKNITSKVAVLYGLGWGVFMIMLSEILLPMILNDERSINNLLFSIPFWLIIGLIVGFVMKRLNNTRKR